MLQQVHVPTDVNDAIAWLGGRPGAVLLAGGTLVMPVINNEATDVQTLVSTRKLGLDGVAVDDGRATIGAATTLADVGRDSRLAFLIPVIESIASPPIRNLATAGGNLFAPQPYGDFAVALLALDASVEIVGNSGSRTSSVAALVDQGLAPAEIVTAVAFDVPGAETWFYTKAMRRKLNSASIVTVAAVIKVADNRVETARIALGGVGPRPLRARSSEAALIGQRLDRESVEAAAALAVNDAQPFSDAYASAWYRTRVLPVHFRRAILGE